MDFTIDKHHVLDKENPILTLPTAGTIQQFLPKHVGINHS